MSWTQANHKYKMWGDSAELQGSQSSSEADESEASSFSNGAAPKHVQNGNGRLPFDVSPGARPVPLVIKYYFAPFQFTFFAVISEVLPAHPAFYSTTFTQSTSTPLRKFVSFWDICVAEKTKEVEEQLRNSTRSSGFLQTQESPVADYDGSLWHQEGTSEQQVST